VSVLNAAEEWGRPPYKLVTDKQAVRWILRRQELAIARADALEYQRKKIEEKRND
jgi:hypothetical protein